MFDTSNVTKEKVIRCKAPLTMEQLRMGIEDPEILYVIDYAGSVGYEGKKLLVYLSNLAINCDIEFSEKVTYEQRAELMLEYMNLKSILRAPVLAISAATILTALKGIDDFYLSVANPMFDKEEVVQFMTDNQILVNQWRIFMDSMVVFTMMTSQEFLKENGNFEEVEIPNTDQTYLRCTEPEKFFPVIDDENVIGKNFTNLFYIPTFMEYFYSVPGTTYYYFKKQFEEYMFNQQNLFHYFFLPGNPLPSIFQIMGTADYDVTKLSEEMDALESQI
jgi:hypothetical protein